MDDRATADAVARVERLLGEIEDLADPAAREKATELVGALLELYGAGLERIMALGAESTAGQLGEALAGDELVSHLLMLHGLHPVSPEVRVLEALDEVRPYLESHGGDVELLAVEEGVARVRLDGTCSGCPSSTMTLKLAIERAIHKAAPDVDRVEAEGLPDEVPPPPGLLQIEVSPRRNGDERPDPGPRATPGAAWSSAGTLAEVDDGTATTRDVDGHSILLLRLGETAYAYRSRCPGCGSSLEGSSLAGETLSCAECGNRYDARRAGRSLDGRELHLEPVPLLVDDGSAVRVALGAAA